MTLEEQQKLFDGFIEVMRDVMLKKGNDYANEDRLHNFKSSANITGISTPRQVLSLIATKVSRLGVLLGKDTIPNNEPIEDSVLDLANYTVLLYMVLNEHKRSDKQPQVSRSNSLKS